TADFLGRSQAKIRIGLQRGLLTFGKAFASPSKTRKNFTTYSYYISNHQVEDYVGMTYEQILERKGENAYVRKIRKNCRQRRNKDVSSR
ncbi:DUF1977 domain-containing protein, partial [Streptobacillus moniliformis]|uniref:DUF1977 domain-containing protein n=1 Tax=Streptobacillus moniliformis TaxID=34105 RepID=UPI0007EEE07C